LLPKSQAMAKGPSTIVEGPFGFLAVSRQSFRGRALTPFDIVLERGLNLYYDLIQLGDQLVDFVAGYAERRRY